MVENAQSEIRDPKSWLNTQANFSALLYVIAEQRALTAKLIEELMKSGAFFMEQIERITAAGRDPETVATMYQELHGQYVKYFIQSQAALLAARDFPSDSEKKGS